MTITIENLYDYPEYIDTVVNWLYSEWGDNNYSFWNSWVRSSVHKNGVPMTFILFVDDTIAGTYSLWNCDIQSRQDLSPWFGGLFVDLPFRGKDFNGKRLGAIMQKHAFKQAVDLGIESLYLFTEKSPKYYIENGWEYIGNAFDEHDQCVSLCKYKVNHEEKWKEKNE